MNLLEWSALEVIAAAFGVISVYLSTRQNIWSWPTAIVNVALYTVVFYQGRLYGQMGLQPIYLALSVYGWYQWLHGGEQHTELRVSRAGPRLLGVLAVLSLVLWLALAAVLRQTDAALPWLDALLTTTSLVAQWMMTRKILENWLIWIAVDVVYVPMFVSQGLYATAVLYAAFLVLAVMGYAEWRRSLVMRPSHA
ncbi:MAG TPA: nicotinamide riboside transporter PnuC [Gemmatimonadaceae bacterium]|nr:nicotinamide riboside transporter PnuC [Gemmatimonadaceae bacterium]